MLYWKMKGMNQISVWVAIKTNCSFLIRSTNFDISIGLGWNDFKIEIGSKDPQIRPTVYILRLRRLPREDNPVEFHASNLTVCILEQVLIYLHILRIPYIKYFGYSFPDETFFKSVSLLFLLFPQNVGMQSQI